MNRDLEFNMDLGDHGEVTVCASLVLQTHGRTVDYTIGCADVFTDKGSIFADLTPAEVDTINSKIHDEAAKLDLEGEVADAHAERYMEGA